MDVRGVGVCVWMGESVVEWLRGWVDLAEAVFFWGGGCPRFAAVLASGRWLPSKRCAKAVFLLMLSLSLRYRGAEYVGT